MVVLRVHTMATLAMMGTSVHESITSSSSARDMPQASTHGDSKQLLDVAGEQRLSASQQRRAKHAVTQRASSRHGAEACQLNDRCHDSVWSSMHVLRLSHLVGFLGELLDRGNKPSFAASRSLQGGNTTSSSKSGEGSLTLSHTSDNTLGHL